MNCLSSIASLRGVFQQRQPVALVGCLTIAFLGAVELINLELLVASRGEWLRVSKGPLFLSNDLTFTRWRYCLSVYIQVPVNQQARLWGNLGNWASHGFNHSNSEAISSYAQGRKYFWKPSKPFRFGIQRKVLTEYSQMSTHLPGFH